jgi:hypothetical protein
MRDSERGVITVAGILLFLVVAAILFVTYKLFPPYIDNYRFQDSIETIARTSTYGSVTENDIRDEVLSEAADLGIPLDEARLAVQKRGGTVSISAPYSLTIDLLVRQVDLEFSPSAGNRNITASR